MQRSSRETSFFWYGVAFGFMIVAGVVLLFLAASPGSVRIPNGVPAEISLLRLLAVWICYACLLAHRSITPRRAP